ncbi:hypothetical protein LOAG_14014 [Loa loa]|uniref:Annexin n=1 Tax=Loa loa TaxID=7209 RepID=A0A1S0TIX1_LOALO|nr:hypothetical protein LOAG_14014 [Loa loa]EFO14504.2 hypothetical protein LOAG_14014 [Loa loa]
MQINTCSTHSSYLSRISFRLFATSVDKKFFTRVYIKYFNGNAKKALLALIQYSRNSNSYFADLLNNSLKVPETRNSDLLRLIISRSEIDLATISEAYMKGYKKKLTDEINRECNGSYRDWLIAIIKGNI